MELSRRRMLFFAGGAGLLTVIAGRRFGLPSAIAADPSGKVPTFAVTHTDAEWKQLLSPQAYEVLRREGTERSFTSPLNDEHRDGVFSCAGCQQPLFSSKTKFDSGTGWPSFWKPLDQAVGDTSDRTLGMLRTEIHCSRCGGHLGHVFDDGPAPTGLRYCMNGVAMSFAAA